MVVALAPVRSILLGMTEASPPGIEVACPSLYGFGTPTVLPFSAVSLGKRYVGTEYHGSGRRSVSVNAFTYRYAAASAIEMLLSGDFSSRCSVVAIWPSGRRQELTWDQLEKLSRSDRDRFDDGQVVPDQPGSWSVTQNPSGGSKRGAHTPQGRPAAPGFNIEHGVTSTGQPVWFMLLRGQRIPSETSPEGRYALMADRAAELTYKLDPQTGKRS